MSFWDGNRWMRDVPADAATTPPPRSRRFLGAAAEAFLITALIFGLIAGTTLAAKGGNGGKGGRTTATLVVAPDPVAPYGTQFSVEGSGFRHDMAVNVVISSPYCCAFTTVGAESDGTLWFVWNTGDPGTYTVEAYQRLNGRKLTLMATTTFEVAAP